MNKAAGTDRGLPEIGSHQGIKSGKWKIHAVLLMTVGMTLTGVSILNVALPSIQKSLVTSESGLQWILTGYALTFGVFLIAAGRAGDVLGQQGLFIVGVGIFALASIAATLAPGIEVLVVARLVQGIGSGIVSPQVIGLIQHTFSGRERARAFGAYGTVVAVSMGVAPFLGGAIIALFGQDTGWRWAIFVNVPVAITAIIFALLWFPRPIWKPRIEFQKLDLDIGGMLLMSLAVLAFMYPFVAPSADLWIWAFPAVGALILLIWVKWERYYRSRGGNPIIDTGIFANRNFSYGVSIGLVYFLGATSIWVIVALYMMDGLGYSALQAGVIGLPSAVCGVLASQWAGRVVTDRGRIVVIIGISASILSLLISALIIWFSVHKDLSIWWLLLSLVGVGFGQGSVVSPNQNLTLTDVPLKYAGSSGGVLQTGQRVGSAIGVAVITAVLFDVTSQRDWSTGAIASLLAVVVALFFALILAILDASTRRRVGVDID